MNELSTQEHKPLGYLEVEDGDKVVKNPLLPWTWNLRLYNLPTCQRRNLS